MNRKISLLILLFSLSFLMFSCTEKKTVASLGIDVNQIESISLMEDYEIVKNFDNLTSDDQIVLTIDEPLQNFNYGRYINNYLNINEDDYELGAVNDRDGVFVIITTQEKSFGFGDTAVTINGEVVHLTVIVDDGVLGFTDIELFNILIALF